MNWQELSDRKLVELCIEGIEDAWVEFLRRYRLLIIRVAAKTLRATGATPSANLLEDLLQESLARILANNMRALRELQWLHEGALRGLLLRVATTATQDWTRKEFSEKRDKSKEESLTDMDMVVPTPIDQTVIAGQKILLGQLANCLQSLIRDEADCMRDIAIFLLFYGHRVTAADLARVYKMNIRKVENTLARLARLARVHCL